MLSDRSGIECRATAALCIRLAASLALALDGLGAGSAAALVEAAHQVIDASTYFSVVQPVCAALLGRFHLGNGLTFGPIRFATLLRFGACIIAMGIATFVGLDICLNSLIELAVPKVHGPNGHGRSHGHAAEVQWSTVFVSAGAALAVTACVDVGSRPIIRRGASCTVLRLSALLLGAWLGAAPLTYGGRGAHAGGDGGSDPPVALLHSAPPLMRALLLVLLHSPDASAGAMLAALALHRGLHEVAAPAKALLQVAPPHALMPDLEQRLMRARTGPGVLAVRDVTLWVLEEGTVIGSLVAIAHADADAQGVMQHVHRTLLGAPLAELTVQVEKDQDD